MLCSYLTSACCRERHSITGFDLYLCAFTRVYLLKYLNAELQLKTCPTLWNGVSNLYAKVYRSKLLYACMHTHSSLEPPATKRPRPLAHPSPSPSLDLDPTPTSVMEAQEQPAQTSEEVGGVAPPMDTQVTESQVRRNTDGRRKT